MTSITVIVPAHDVAATLPEQLDALLAQEWDGEWEVVVVDNRSTDATPDIVRERASADPRLRLVAASERAGLSYARNVGFEAARGDAVLICDGDDVVAPGWLAAMARALDGAECVTGRLDVTQINPPWLAASRGVYPEDRALTWHGAFPVASGGNLGLRVDTWRRMGPFRDDFIGAEDHEYSLRLAVAGIPIVFVPDAVVHYRLRGDARTLWRQGRTYGRNRPRLRRLVVRAGLAAPGRLAGWRSWLWLGLHLPDLRRASGRARWCWVAGNRVGQLEGSLRDRTVFL